MILGSYQASCECRGTFEHRRSCVTILDDMEVTQSTEIFGPGSDPAAQVKLPAVVKASKMFSCFFCGIAARAYINELQGTVKVHSECWEGRIRRLGIGSGRL